MIDIAARFGVSRGWLHKWNTPRSAKGGRTERNLAPVAPRLMNVVKPRLVLAAVDGSHHGKTGSLSGEPVSKWRCADENRVGLAHLRNMKSSLLRQ